MGGEWAVHLWYTVTYNLLKKNGRIMIDLNYILVWCNNNGQVDKVDI